MHYCDLLAEQPNKPFMRNDPKQNKHLSGDLYVNDNVAMQPDY